jgi:hypothetical protein
MSRINLFAAALIALSAGVAARGDWRAYYNPDPRPATLWSPALVPGVGGFYFGGTYVGFGWGRSTSPASTWRAYDYGPGGYTVPTPYSTPYAGYASPPAALYVPRYYNYRSYGRYGDYGSPYRYDTSPRWHRDDRDGYFDRGYGWPRYGDRFYGEPFRTDPRHFTPDRSPRRDPIDWQGGSRDTFNRVPDQRTPPVERGGRDRPNRDGRDGGDSTGPRDRANQRER